MMREILFTLCAAVLFAAGPVQAAAPGKDDKPLINMGGTVTVLRNAPKQDAEIAFNSVLDEALIHSPVRVHLTVYPSLKELLAAFHKGEVNGFFGTPLEYLSLPVALGEQSMALQYENTSIKQHYVVLARKTEKDRSLRDFSRGRLSLSRLQDIEELYLNTFLLRNGLPEIPDFFSERSDPKTASIAIMDVYFGKAEMTVVPERDFKTATELNPQVGKQLVILDSSPPMIPTIGAVSKVIDHETINGLMKDIEAISRKGGKLSGVIQNQSIVKISRDEINSVIELKREYEALKTNKPNSPKPRSLFKLHQH